MCQFHRLVYYSRNTMPGSIPEIAAEVGHILAKSRRNNSALGVTGALMFSAGCFAQVLEGPRAALEQTFERIQRDTRHAAVVVLEYAPVEARAFPNWSMAFVGENARHREAFEPLGAESDFDPAQFTADEILQKLHSLVREEEAAAA